ncbi:MAG: DUF393 domain-containing protein, partial [Gammaproteobacteria bacterium]|nr:DUF393 domain-containing protein [Gammaproteobacteria bacterium]
LRIFYDEPCGFCRKICFLFRTFMMLGDARIAAAQSNDAVLKQLRKYDSWVVYDHNDQQYVRWRAVLLVMQHSPLLWPFGYVLVMLGMGKWGDPLYRLIGASRTFFSSLTSIVIPYRKLRYSMNAADYTMAIVWLLVFTTTLIFSNTPYSSNALSLIRGYLGLL